MAGPSRPIPTITPQTISKDGRARPPRSSPVWTAAMVRSVSERRLLKGRISSPSATSAVMVVMSGPSAPSSIGGGPKAVGPGLNMGVMRVWW